MILHIASLSTKHIMFPFVEFTNKNFEENNHHFLFCSNKSEQVLYTNATIKNVFHDNEYFISNMQNAEKIILHGIWYDELCEMLLLDPSFLKKTYWVMWGGDFYFPEKQSFLKKQVIKKMGHLITYIKGDYELVKESYSVTATQYKCFMYPSNLYKEYDLKSKKCKTINIQVGNSADYTNNHLEIFEKLKKYKNEDINIFVPLSYGNQEYAKDVIKKGNEIFKNKFTALTHLMPLEKYIEFLGAIDIAIFAHKRQQTMGNASTLLGLGKKVYMRGDTTSFHFFSDIGVKVFDIDNIELKALSNDEKNKNNHNIREYFSKRNYLNQLKKIFED